MSPLVIQAVSCLSNHLPITDVAQVEFSFEGDLRSEQGGAAVGWGAADLSSRIQRYYAQAAPALRHTPSKHRSGIHQVVTVGAPGLSDESPPARGDALPEGKDHCFLLIPASDSGKRYGEQAQEVLSGLHLVNVPGQADLMFCREQEELALEDLERILRACRSAYETIVRVPQTSPHARFDIQDWMPIDP